jgi:hypothetical protein
MSSLDDLFDELNQLRAEVEALKARLARPLPITASFPIEVRRHPAGVHVALASLPHEAYVILTTDLASGSSGQAKIQWLQGGNWADAATHEITVYDVIGTMEGRAGDKALVRFHPQSGRWIVWQLQC